MIRILSKAHVTIIVYPVFCRIILTLATPPHSNACTLRRFPVLSGAHHSPSKERRSGETFFLKLGNTAFYIALLNVFNVF